MDSLHEPVVVHLGQRHEAGLFILFDQFGLRRSQVFQVHIVNNIYSWNEVQRSQLGRRHDNHFILGKQLVCFLHGALKLPELLAVLNSVDFNWTKDMTELLV